MYSSTFSGWKGHSLYSFNNSARSRGIRNKLLLYPECILQIEKLKSMDYGISYSQDVYRHIGTGTGTGKAVTMIANMSDPDPCCTNS